MKFKRLTTEEAKEILENSTGTFFSVEFIKRTTGERRKMLCKTGVKGKNGGVPAYDFNEKGLMSVWEVREEAFKCFPYDGLEKIRIKGRGFIVK